MTITVEQPVTTAVFTASIDPPREIQAGFARHICIEYTDYGPQNHPDDEQFTVQVRVRGRAKGPSGNPDRRTREGGLLVCFDWSELPLALEVMRQISHPLAQPTIDAIQARIDRLAAREED